MPTDSRITNIASLSSQIGDKIQNKGIRKYVSKNNRNVPVWLQGLPVPLPESTSLLAS